MQQLKLDLSDPGNHAEYIHSGTRHGTVLFWERAAGGNRWTKCSPHQDLPALARQLRATVDTYLSVNAFNGWRRVSLLKSLRAVYVDLDGMQDLEAALDVLASARMPAPSFAVMSGRGLHLYWLLQSTPAKALPVWQRLQDTLIKTLEQVGVDKKCRDCTRVLRLAGTINSKSETECRGILLTGTEWDLHSLADEILGPRPARPPSRPKAMVRDIDAAAARRGRKSAPAGSIYAWWHLVYTDLVRLVQLAHRGQAPVGQRNNLLFVHAVALSWFAQADALEDEIMAAGRLITNLSDSEIRQSMQPVIERSRLAAEGGKIKWGEQDRDPRYFFKAETLRDWVGHDLVDRFGDQLRALAPAALIEERRAERDAARWSDHNSGKGYRLGNEEKRATARLMRAGGDGFQSIADSLGVSVGSVHKWCKD